MATGHRIRNNRGARVTTHRLEPPVPIAASIVWEHDGEERIETVALGWSNGDAYVRLIDSQRRFTAIWLGAEDVTRR